MSGPGIDYGHGKTNIDLKTGIRYGIISQHSVNPDAMDDVYRGDNLTYSDAVDDLLEQVEAALFGILRNTAMRREQAKDVARQAAESLLDDVGGDAVGETDNAIYGYSQDGYELRTTSDNELFVFKSPFYTYARYCSPCVPGAGNLDNATQSELENYPTDKPCCGDRYDPEHNMKDYGAKTYCLDNTWFDGGQSPYPFWKVEK